MYLGPVSGREGSHSIICPWQGEHTTGDAGTFYYEPNFNGYTNPAFQCLHVHCKDKKIEDLKNYLEIISIPKIQLHQPLFRPLIPSSQFPVKALGPILQGAAETLNRIIGAPLNLCSQSVLGCAGLITQPYFNVLVDGRIYPLSLYMISVGESGERKTAIDNVVLDAVRSYEKEMLIEYQREYQRFKNQSDLYEKKENYKY